MIQMVETILVKCLKATIDLETFYVVRLAAFNGNALKMDFKRTPLPQLTQESTKSIFSITVVDTTPVYR